LIVLAWVGWCRDILGPSRFFAPLRLRVPLALNAVLCLAAILLVLLTASAQDGRHNSNYVMCSEMLAAFWLMVGLWLFPFFGISPQDDVVERRNVGAFWAVNGALIGFAACFAGANVGNEPAAVVFGAVLASASFFLVWFVADLAGGHWADTITIDRDFQSGLRLGCLLLGTGLGFGSAVTGNWVSVDATIGQFLVRSWPVVVVLCVALVAERPLRRSPNGVHRWVAPMAYVALAAVSICVERRMR
jgi:hypothetical protein